MPVDYIIAGLGNPGDRYKGTRHNVGFLLVSKLAERHGTTLNKKKYRSLVGEIRIGNRRLLLALPQTYMNLSGQALRLMSSYTGTEPSRIIVAHDDLDLPLGRIKIKTGGGTGGHRGLKSIAESLGTNAFLRLKIGIDRPSPGSAAEEYVLSPFGRGQHKLLLEAVDRGMAACESLISDGPAKAMSLHNSPSPPDESAKGA